MSPSLGCVADDYTGGTDVAAALRRSGLRTVLLFCTPPHGTAVPDCDAVVIALKTRSVPVETAVAESLAAWRWLAGQGVGRIYVKYCSTFDSTDDGNIGPVADVLVEAAGARLTVACPASPEHGRTVYQGHLFVGDRLLSESPMRHHPLTPMTDSDLVRVLGRQTPHPVALVPHAVVARGADAVRAALDDLEARGVRHAVTDAIDDHDLDTIARATAHLPVITGAAGLGRAAGTLLAAGTPGPTGVPGVSGPTTTTGSTGATGPIETSAAVGMSGPTGVAAPDGVAGPSGVSGATGETGASDVVQVPGEVAVSGATSSGSAVGMPELPAGPSVVLAGSCSAATLQQVARARERMPSYRLRPENGGLVEEAIQWLESHFGAGGPVMVYSSAPPEERSPGTAEPLERALAAVAARAAELGARRFVVAGGETSGAVVNALGVTGVIVGAEADPGVPWLLTTGDRPLALLLKSGNFGRPDLLVQAVEAT
ncbi:four-carbon acid sugar kinase family protein [Nonomuraea sp. NPDC049269]|uniref:four-carbon acid sugar kinase family protein n=1 Tax=Nonomuraea sp. NPDC049269 TaxID=3364349 RepID=UPI0037161110